MPAQSKSQQRFFGVVKAMQKGDIPKKGRAGKIAKQMSKKDVDDFASTKHKGKPEKVKREQRVRELIKKMVREELDERMKTGPLTPKQSKEAGSMKNYLKKNNPFREEEDDLNESSDTFVNILNKFGFKKGARDWGGHQFFVHKSKNLYATYNANGRSLVIEPKRGGKPVFDSDRSNFSIRALLSYLQSPKNKFVSTEGTCGYGENGELGEEPAGPHLIKKKKIKESGRNIAKTILQQLGGNKFIAMTGAKNLGFTNNGLQMKIGRNSKGITHVIISLKSTDTYDVEFIKMRGVNRKVVKKLKGVYADQLGKIFTKFTGLRTRL